MGLGSTACASFHMCIVGGIFDVGGHDKSLVGPIPLVGTIEGIPDIDAVVEVS